MDKKNRKPYFVIAHVVSHSLGKDAAYNADDRAGPYAPHFILINFIAFLAHLALIIASRASPGTTTGARPIFQNRSRDRSAGPR